MKILVIGGTYFLGKHFCDIAESENELILINRGSKSNQSEKIREFHMDRHDALALSKLDLGDVDVVVDFCAYQKDDIKIILDSITSSIIRYIFVSTVDVYARGLGKCISEDDEFELRDFGGEEGAYIKGKVALENEIREECSNRGIEYTSVRPAFIYGPDNYAPREGIFFNWIMQAGQVLNPTRNDNDTDGRFQMVYVDDLARAIYTLCKKEAIKPAYNIASNSITYSDFFDACEKALDMKIEKINIDISEVNARGIPLPFPLTIEESECYSSNHFDELGMEFISIEEGLKNSYNWYIENEK